MTQLKVKSKFQPEKKQNFFYPLVNVYITMERSTMLFMGKSTISMAIFNSFLYVYQAGSCPLSVAPRCSQKKVA